jgi:HlyD family secretion protein
MKKVLLGLLLLIVLAGAGFAFLRMRDNGPEGIEIQSESVGRAEIVQTITATGRIQPKTQINISADVSAKITRLEVEEGQSVERGALLVELDRERYLAAVESSQASLRVAQANATVSHENMIKAQKDYVRIQDLHEANLETQAQLDSAKALLEAEKARHKASGDQVEQARANLKQLEDDLSKTRIHAPMSGTISQLNKEAGEMAVGAQFQEDVILVLSNLAGMEAEVKVDENDIVSVALGDRAVIEVDALPEIEFNGRVTEIASSASIAGTGTVDQKTEFVVKVEITDEVGQLRPGMTATAEIVTDVRDDSLALPIQAVAVRTVEQLSSGDEDTERWTADKDGFVELVFVVDDDKVEARQVTTGIQSDTHVEIVEGIAEGEQIVTGNYRAISRDLEDGSKVIVEGEGAEASGGSS